LWPILPGTIDALLIRAMARRAEPITVLVVDDDYETRTIYHAYLAQAGCRVRTANDGQDAIEKAMRWTPDVIVMDLAMPRMDGWTASKWIKTTPATKHIPIIALSDVQMARNEARAAGCDAYLAKPCLPDMLWWEIRALLRPQV
jgi:CheY-like chemotaxis protein